MRPKAKQGSGRRVVYISLAALVLAAAAAALFMAGRGRQPAPGVQTVLLRQEGTAYPHVTSPDNPPLLAKLNAAIEKAARRAVPDYDPGTGMIEATSSYKETLNANGLLSLRFEDYYYPEKAAHGVTGVSSVTLGLADGRSCRLADFFLEGSGYLGVLDGLLRGQVASREIPLLEPLAGVGPDEDYYLTDTALVIYYQPYVYTPGAYGVLEFELPYGELSRVLDPDGPLGWAVKK